MLNHISNIYFDPNIDLSAPLQRMVPASLHA